MPRPAPKRNRTKPSGHLPAEKRDNDATQSPERGSTLDPRQALRSQTPMTTSYEQAIESSPTGSRPGTGSRPPTRSRGYSSTLSLAGRKGDNSRIPGTPGYDSSVLSNFRRRPRQQSILQMMQADDGSSELDDDDFLGGFSPQDESTPLNLSRGKSLLVRTEQSPSPSESLPSSGRSRKRRHAEEEILVPESSMESAQDMVEDTPTATPIARVPSSHPSEATPRAVPFPDILSQTLAPPTSSPGLSTNGSVADAAPGKKSSDPAQLPTAVLQNRLLPRRRQRRKNRAAGDFDVPSDDSDDDMHDAASGDDDELNYQPSRRGDRSNKPKPLSNTRARSNQKKKKTRARLASAPKPTEPGPTTYGRSRGSGNGGVDKENEMLSSPGSSPLSSPPDTDVDLSDSEAETGPGRRFVSDELRAAAKKFAEVDKWQMEFEDVSASEA
ncbi:hypothetical protein N7468_005722 [Penicillium chermesinum]|uniref:Uncharacterized protein n=1 Tax=Penicillium chermesinum TaxID=63820 RepID=A0A9W9P034_9EURO|nr:uncharacterized protein N7468_005722 [Penicillium chermesinum]KAJ5232766.1 hypothetical protein N7468_005722 [Penicillium chermesinum]KAJ6172425.1 hypothetical protein N7470_001492 [Penicillium chermesinum]